ncbi:MAG: hypothetical protein ACT4OS_04470 [Acidimicrobiales bacterium]
MQKVQGSSATVAGRAFNFTITDVERVMADVDPEPLRTHFAIVGGLRYPPKQVLAAVTGLDRADFTTHQARSVLRRIGLGTGRLTDWKASTPEVGSVISDQDMVAEAEELRPHRGRWVALLDGRVLVSADQPQQVLGWLRQHDQVAETMFRVPMDPAADTGGFGW